MIETTGDPSLKATDSSAGAMQDGSDKHHKKVCLLNLVTPLRFTFFALPCCVFTQLQSTGYPSLYHGLLPLKHLKTFGLALTTPKFDFGLFIRKISYTLI